MAWCGWQMRIPLDWRPLRVSGNRLKGMMTVGDSTQAHMQIKWLQAKSRGFVFAEWVSRRVATLQRKDKTETELCRLAGTDEPCRIVQSLPIRETSRRCAYAYSREASQVIEVVSFTPFQTRHSCSPKRSQTSVSESSSETLPIQGGAHPLFSLEFSDLHSPTRWAVFDVSFITPTGYDIETHRINLGDMAFRFAHRGGQRLVLRQVYPSETALARREMSKWLDDRPFKEHKLLKCDQIPQTITFDSTGTQGLLRRGRKRLPFPLHSVATRHSISAIAHDTDFSRLLMAEYDSPSSADEEVVLQVMRDMNWHKAKGAGR